MNEAEIQRHLNKQLANKKSNQVKNENEEKIQQDLKRIAEDRKVLVQQQIELQEEKVKLRSSQDEMIINQR